LVSVVAFWYWNQQYRPFRLVVSTISGIMWVITGHMGSIDIRPKYQYLVIFQTLESLILWLLGCVDQTVHIIQGMVNHWVLMQLILRTSSHEDHSHASIVPHICIVKQSRSPFTFLMVLTLVLH